MTRCFGDGDPLYERYHDEEWGRPQTTARQLYEKVCLEGFQAGLAWIRVLRKREALREAFGGFDPAHVATMDVEPLLTDARLIRSRAKLEACVRNARAALEVDLPALVGEYAEVPSPAYASWHELPASTPRSAELAKRLKKAGFVFVGPTTVYSLLQACGYVGDHLTSCPVRDEAERLRSAAFSS